MLQKAKDLTFWNRAEAGISMKTKDIRVKAGMLLKMKGLVTLGAECGCNCLLRHPEGDAWPDTGPTTARS